MLNNVAVALAVVAVDQLQFDVAVVAIAVALI